MEGTREDRNILKVDRHTQHLKFPEDIFHGPLRSFRGVTNAVRHLSGLKKTFARNEGALLAVFGGELNLPVAAGEIHGQEIFGGAKDAEGVVNTGKGSYPSL